MRTGRTLLILTTCLISTGCAGLLSSATSQMAQNLSSAMLNNNDPETIRAAAPAYLVMLDSLVQNDPEDTDTLLAASRLYGSYSSAFVRDEKRARLLADKSLDYARKALCLELTPVCTDLDAPLEQFNNTLAGVTVQEQPLLYGFASAWANWVRMHSDDWNAVAQVPRLVAMFDASVQLNENYDDGNAHLYLGVLHSQLPAHLGGKPELARAHFERAQAISHGHNLMVNVLFAEHYARLLFNRELHDKLLQEVLASDEDQAGLALSNALARQRAAELLADADEFF